MSSNFYRNIVGGAYYDDPMTDETVGDRIRKQRKTRKLSQADLGRLVGMKQSSISDIETAKSGAPNAWHLEEIAKVFGVSPDYLLHGLDKPDTPYADLGALFQGLRAEQQRAVYDLVRAMSKKPD